MNQYEKLCPTCGQLLPRRLRDPRALTEREWQVALLIAQGKRNREIGDMLCIDFGTVRNHVHNILHKRGFNSRLQIALLMNEESKAP